MRVLQDRYTIVREIGRGGEGAIYLCEDRRLPGSLWAVKELPFQDSSRSAFEREAAVLAQLDHPRIPVMVDFFVQEPFGYLVREYLDGPTLYRWIEKSGAVSEAQALQWGVQLAEVLAYLHQRQPPIYHRDLKPQNLIVLKDGLRLIDFGLAREHQADQERYTRAAGSVSFTAPEQLSGEHRLEPSADIFSLGAILYYLLMGVPPSPTGGEHRLLKRRPDLQPATEELVLQCLQSEPSLRPSDISQVLSALNLLALRFPPPETVAPAFTPPPRPRAKPVAPKPWRRQLLLAGIPLLALVATATWLALTPKRPTSTPTPRPTQASSSVVAWRIIQDYLQQGRWAEAEGALRATLAAQPGSGWAQLLLEQLPLRKSQGPRLPLLLPLGGQEEEHVNWILQGVALGQADEKRFFFDLVDTHATPALKAWQSLKQPDCVLGPFGTSESLLLAPVVGKSILLPIGTSDARLREAAPNIFPLGFPHASRMATILEHCSRSLGPRGLILYPADSKAMLASAQSAHKKVAPEVPLVAFGEGDEAAELLAPYQANPPDWIYLSDNQQVRAARWVDRLRRQGLKAPVVCVFHPASEQFVHELEEVDGEVWLVELLWQQRDPAFVKRCQRQFGVSEVDWNCALGYDVARVASRLWPPSGQPLDLDRVTELPAYSGLLGSYHLGPREFQAHPFRYRLVKVINGRRQVADQL